MGSSDERHLDAVDVLDERTFETRRWVVEALHVLDYPLLVPGIRVCKIHSRDDETPTDFQRAPINDDGEYRLQLKIGDLLGVAAGPELKIPIGLCRTVEGVAIDGRSPVPVFALLRNLVTGYVLPILFNAPAFDRRGIGRRSR